LITEQRLTPRIYVASLSDYNAGRLHGRWIDATQDREAIFDEIQAMLADSPEAIAEEFAIHDFDDFGGIRLGEWEDVDHVCELAAALVAHGLAFAAWYASADVEAATSLAEQFQEAYCGEFDSLADYAKSWRPRSARSLRPSSPCGPSPASTGNERAESSSSPATSGARTRLLVESGSSDERAAPRTARS
jgi:antirestriction protein